MMTLEPIPFNLHAAVEEVAELLAWRAQEKGLELIVHYPPGTPRHVIGDQGRVRQVLTNLVGNAIKFTGQGSVRIAVRIMEQVAECSVADTGIGIAKEDLGELFQQFRQFRRPVRGGEQGTGLGLAIAKKLVDLHGGGITADSELGRGTRFAFRLPRLSSDELLRQTIDDALRRALTRQASVSLVLIGFEPAAPGELLEELAYWLRRDVLRQQDLALRTTTGLALVLVDCQPNGVQAIAGRIGDALRAELSRLQREAALCIGWATYPTDAADVGELIRLAMDRKQ